MPDSARRTTRITSVLLVFGGLVLVACEEPQQEAEIVRPVRAMKVQDVAGYRARPGKNRAL